MLCPCGSSALFLDCCDPYLRDQQWAPTPEALMRSRYTAFVVHNVPYLEATMKPPASRKFNVKETAEFIESVQWQGLTVFQSKLKSPTCGYVSFDAVYTLQGKTVHICEKSEFHKINDRWFYVDGKPLNPARPKQA